MTSNDTRERDECLLLENSFVYATDFHFQVCFFFSGALFCSVTHQNILGQEHRNKSINTRMKAPNPKAVETSTIKSIPAPTTVPTIHFSMKPMR